jgi:hypothetical protein
MKSTIVTVILTFLLWQPSFCQDKSLRAARLKSVQDNYMNTGVSGVLSGKTYNLKYLYAVNSQFYNDSDPTIGSLVYDGVFFSSIEIQYDLFAQRVIVLFEANDSRRYIAIDSEKVSEFTIEGFQFTHVRRDSVMAEGIYELAYAGNKTTLFIKRIKDRREKTIEGKNVLVFSQDDKYYLKNQFGTFHITNKKSFYYAYQFSDEIKNLVKENKIKFSKKKLEQGLFKAVSILDKEE